MPTLVFVIASVAFQRFKALRNTAVRLEPCNLVIGPNGSGKTSLIEALLQLRTLARLEPGRLADPRTLRQDGPGIIVEFGPPHAPLSAHLICVSELRCDGLLIEPAEAPGWPALRSEIARVRSFTFDHVALAAPSAWADGEQLAGNGRNVAAVLARLRESSPAEFAALTAELVRIVPEFSGIDLTRSAEGMVSLSLVLGDGGAVVPATSLSQGTLYLLALLALTFTPEPPSLVCIEEVDRGVHPRLLREVRDLLYRLSYPASLGLKRVPVQVVATTHSPYLLDQFRDHPEEIIMTEKHGAEATFQRLADRTDLAELLQEGSLGDLWFSGILGGVPQEP